jgi:hypothetical protein
MSFYRLVYVKGFQSKFVLVVDSFVLACTRYHMVFIIDIHLGVMNNEFDVRNSSQY